VVKRIACKVINSSPFAERRKRDDLRGCKNNRFSDISSANINEAHAINSATYVKSSGNIKTSANCSITGKILDCYA